MSSWGQIMTGAGEAVGATALVGQAEGMEGSPRALVPQQMLGRGNLFKLFSSHAPNPCFVGKQVLWLLCLIK